MSESDGLIYCLEYLYEFGLFPAQLSWSGADQKDENVLLIRYEDLFGACSAAVISRIMGHCDIELPGDQLDALLQAYRFEQLSGRARGQEDRTAHYRKGVAGDWRIHFNKQIESRFEQVAGDVLTAWRYE